MAEPLRTGWEPDTRATDTAHLAAVRSIASCWTHAPATMGGRVEHHDHVALGDLCSPSWFSNIAVLRQPPVGTRLDDVLDRIDRFFPGSHAEHGFAILSPWPLPDLTARGLSLEGHPPLMLRPPSSHAVPNAPGLVVEEVVDGDGLRDYERVFVDGFPVTELQGAGPGAFLDERVLGASLRLWVGRVEGEPVAVASAYVGEAVVQVEWVATLPAARRRGYGEVLTWRAVDADPTRPAVLISSDDGRPVYERMGFVALTRFTLWYRPPAKGSASGDR